MKPTAVVGRRVVAFLIDGLLLTALNAALFFALADTTDELVRQALSGDLDPNANLYVNLELGDTEYSVTGGKAAAFFGLTFLIGFGYWVVLQGITGATIGKAMTGIRLVRDDGSRAGIWRSFVRQFLWIVDSFPYLIPYLTGFIAAKVSSRNKRVGDMVAGTVVVKKAFAGQPDAGGLDGAGGSSSPAFSPAEPQRSSEPLFAGSGAPATTSPGAEPQQAPAAPAGWHPDPKGEKRLRYWDGSSWTDHTAD